MESHAADRLEQESLDGDVDGSGSYESLLSALQNNSRFAERTPNDDDESQPAVAGESVKPGWSAAEPQANGPMIMLARGSGRQHLPWFVCHPLPG